MDLSAELIRLRAETDPVQRQQMVKAMLTAELSHDSEQVDSWLTAIAEEEDIEVIGLLKSLLGRVAGFAEHRHIERVLDAWRIERNDRLLGCWSDLLAYRPDLGSCEAVVCLIEAVVNSRNLFLGMRLYSAMSALTEYSSDPARKLFCEWVAGPGKVVRYDLLDKWSAWMSSAGAVEVETLLEGLHWNIADSRRGRCAFLLSLTAHTRIEGVFEKILSAYEEECRADAEALGKDLQKPFSPLILIRENLAKALKSWSWQAQSEHLSRLLALLEHERVPYARVDLNTVVSRLSYLGSTDLLQWYLVDLIRPMAEGYDHDPLAWRVENYRPWLKWATPETLDWFTRQLDLHANATARWVMRDFIKLCRLGAPHLFQENQADPD